MLSMDPMTPVQAVLLHVTVMITEKQLQIRIDEEKRKLVASDPSIFFQVRAMKMDSKVKYMIKFPDK